ncbi:MAG: DUF881 domain-containing protein [Vampirovibrionales bacterium]|nr:DUF881 domain-containing protein [Vampirovibrionales bacterium]
MAAARVKPAPPYAISRLNRWAFPAFGAAMLFALAFISAAILLNHLRIAEEVNTAPTRRIQDLVALLTQAEARQESLTREIQQLRDRLAALNEPANADALSIHSSAARPRDREYQQLLRQAGFTEMEGPGIVVTLKEAAPSSDALGRAVAQNRIQSDDLLKLLNDLRAAGAQAISVNGQRLVTTSAVVNAGPAILINQTRISSPIEIHALGNREALRGALEIRGGTLEYLKFFGIQATLRTERRLKTPPYAADVSGV